METKRFMLDNGEKLFREGTVNYVRGFFRATTGTGYLTSKRFVCCKNPSLLLFGALVNFFVKGEKIIFEIPLAQLSSKDGTQYAIQFASKPDSWLSDIKQAAKYNNQDVKITEIGVRIEFV